MNLGIILHNVYAVLRRVSNTVEDVQYCEGLFSSLKGYSVRWEDVQYCGGYSILFKMFSIVKGCSVLWEDIQYGGRMFSTVEGIKYC